MARVPEKVRQGQRQDARQAPQHDDDQSVLPGEADRRVGCAEKPQDRIQEQAYEDRISYCQKHRSVCAERADFPCGAVLFSSHQPGYQASAADAEQVGKRDVEHDHGQGDRRRRHHIGVAGSSDEKGIYHVVDQIDELADDRRHSHGCKRLQNGRFRKQLIFADCIIMLCHCVSPGCLKSGRAPVRFYNYRSVLGLTLPHTCASGRSFSSFPRQRASPSY